MGDDVRKVDAVILANGDFPRVGSEARRLLESSGCVVACDGAARTFVRRLHRRVDYVVGDMDSLVGACSRFARHPPVVLSEQETNDLAKAIAFCRARGWRRLVVVGASGKRDDHALGNVFRVLEARIEMWTDQGRFIPFSLRRNGRYGLRLTVAKGTPISVFSTDRSTRMVSRGLAWPLDGVRFENLYCATLNRSVAKRVEIESSCFGFAFVAANALAE